jgi:hypothetical protein
VQQTNGTMLNGTLDYTITVANIPCGPSSTYTQTTYSDFSFAGQAISGQQVFAEGYGSYNCPNYTQPASLPLTLPGTNGSTVPAGNCVFNFSTGNGSATCPQLQTSLFDPYYKLVSIVYDPPGNQSIQNYGSLLTDATTTTIANSFTFSDQITYNFGIISGLSAGGTFGTSTTSTDSTAFTETFQNAQSYGADLNDSSLNPTGVDGKNPSDEMNHRLDEFNIWLNPEVDVVSTIDGVPVSYSLTLQPVPNESNPQLDKVLQSTSNLILQIQRHQPRRGPI